MTATLPATSQAVTEWTKIFPAQITESLTSSVTFMKQLTVVAVSTITFLKNAFPEDNYMMENFGGMRIVTLKNKCNDELAQFLSTALTQAFDAFDKKYLQQLALCFYDGDCKADNLLEYHIFEYTYRDNGVTMSISSKSRDMKLPVTCTLDSVKAQTTHLIRACVVMMQTCPQALPETCDVSLRLYYNDDAPESYQAPGYQCANADDPLGQTYEESLKLGCVETPYHKLTLRTYVRDNLKASHEAIPSQNPPAITQPQDDYASTINSTRNSVTSEMSDPILKCACNNYDYYEDPPSALLRCQYCYSQQHATCYGILPQQASRVARHCCVDCSDRDSSRTPTDSTIAAVKSKKRESIAIFRRALEYCSHSTSINSVTLTTKFGLSSASGAKLITLLAREGIVQDTDSPMTPAIIIHEKLKSVMSHYFQNMEENIIDRLVAESTSESADPVGDILSPIEKVTLGNESKMSKVVLQEINNNIEESALKPYKEAFILVERVDDNIPLSGDVVKDMENIEKTAAKRKGGDRIGNSGVKNKRAKIKRSNN